MLAQLDPVTQRQAIIAGCAVLAILFAGFLGVHHPRTVIGPERLEATDRRGPLWFAAAVGFYSLYLPGTIYLLVQSPGVEPATAPATQMALSPRTSALLGTAQQATVLLAILVMNAIYWPGWTNRLGLALRRLPFGVAAGLLGIAIVLPLMAGVGELTQVLWNWVRLDHPSAHALLRAMEKDPDHSLRASIIATAVLLAPVAEELLFRGLLQTAILYSIARSTPGTRARWGAIVITSLVFTLYHPELWMMPPIFTLSLFLGYIYERTGNLWSCILVHAGFNVANVTLFLLQNGH